VGGNCVRETALRKGGRAGRDSRIKGLIVHIRTLYERNATANQTPDWGGGAIITRETEGIITVEKRRPQTAKGMLAINRRKGKTAGRETEEHLFRDESRKKEDLDVLEEEEEADKYQQERGGEHR